jgi:hypothetical protein
MAAPHGNHPRRATECGRSSGVERHLAKVDVVGSNPIARSIFVKYRILRGDPSVGQVKRALRKD